MSFLKQKIAFAGVLCLLSTVSFSMDIRSKGTITEVIVYPYLSSLSRTITRTLPAGEHNFIFSPLPRNIASSSLRSFAKGNTSIILLGAEIKTIYKKVKNKGRIKILKDKIKKISDRINYLDQQLLIIQQEIDFLHGIKKSSLKKRSNKGKTRHVTPGEWSRLYGFVFTKIYKKTKEKFNLDNKIEKLKQKKNDLNDEYRSIYRGTSRYYKEAVVKIKVKRRGYCRVKITYQQRGSSWYPSYDVRLNKNKKSIELTYFGTVKQKTGELWKNISLKLSTAQVSGNNSIPTVYPWYLSKRYIYKRRSYGRKSYKKMDDSLSESRKGFSSRLLKRKEKLFDSEKQISRIRKGDTAVTFEIPGRTTVKSDGSKVKKVLNIKTLPIVFQYRAMPGFSRKVYIEGTIKNKSDLHLLPGSVNIFRNSQYIGKTSISAIAPNGKVKMFFGTDPGITVKKEQLIRKKDPGSDNEIFYKYRLTVVNNKSRAINLNLVDTLPVSKNTKIEVDIKSMSLKPMTKDDRGIYTWKLNLKPGEKKVIIYSFEIEFPSSYTIRGLR